MPKKPRESEDKSVELLARILVFQMHALGAAQGRMAKAVGRSKSWVNDLLRGLPKGGRAGGGQTQGKKARKRSSSR